MIDASAIAPSIASFTEKRLPARDEVVAFVSINWIHQGVRLTARDRSARHVVIEMTTAEFAELIRDANAFFARDQSALLQRQTSS